MAFLTLLTAISSKLTASNISEAIMLVEKLIVLSESVLQHTNQQTDNSNNNPPQNCSASGS